MYSSAQNIKTGQSEKTLVINIPLNVYGSQISYIGTGRGLY